MVRTAASVKQDARRKKAAQPKAGITKSAVAAPRVSRRQKAKRKAEEPKKRRARSGTKALSEIRNAQRSTKLLVQKTAMRKVIVECIADAAASTDSLRITATAVAAIQMAAEAFVTDFLKDANKNAVHAGRVMLMVNDIERTKSTFNQFTPLPLKSIYDSDMMSWSQHRAERSVYLREQKEAREARKREAGEEEGDGEKDAADGLEDEPAEREKDADSKVDDEVAPPSPPQAEKSAAPEEEEEEKRAQVSASPVEEDNDNDDEDSGEIKL